MQTMGDAATKSPVVADSQKKLMLGIGGAVLVGITAVYLWQRSAKRSKSSRRRKK